MIGLKIKTSNHPLIIAHRGGAATAPENTAAALTQFLGWVDGVEFDVRQTADQRLVALHDADLVRIAGRDRRVSDCTLSELSELDVGSWFDPAFSRERILDLAQALDLILPEAIPFIERKSGEADLFVEVLRNMQAVDRVVLMGFDWVFLEACRQLEPDLPCCALGKDELTATVLDEISRRKFPMIGWRQEDVEASTVTRAHEIGLQVLAWTVNRDDCMRMRASGVDGMISDEPLEMVVRI